MIKMTFDIDGLQKQIKILQQKVLQGVKDGQNNAGDYMCGIMQVYMDQTVYDVYDPEQSGPSHYVRTKDLRNSIRAKVDGTALYIYSDSSGLDETMDGVYYNERVAEGHMAHPYDFPFPNASGDFRQPRNWVEVTVREFKANMEQSGQYMGIIREAVRRQIGAAI